MRENAPEQGTSEVMLERKRLRMMEWGLAVAIVTAVAAVIVPFATGALASEEAGDTRTREQITELLGRTARLEEGQQNLKEDVAELREDVKALEADLKDFRSTMATDLKHIRTTITDNKADMEADLKDIRTTIAENQVAIARNQGTLESIERLLAARLPAPR